jgi:hypothetical protein
MTRESGDIPVLILWTRSARDILCMTTLPTLSLIFTLWAYHEHARGFGVREYLCGLHAGLRIVVRNDGAANSARVCHIHKLSKESAVQFASLR